MTAAAIFIKKKKKKKLFNCATVHRLSAQQQIAGSQQIAGAALKSKYMLESSTR